MLKGGEKKLHKHQVTLIIKNKVTLTKNRILIRSKFHSLEVINLINTVT